MSGPGFFYSAEDQARNQALAQQQAYAKALLQQGQDPGNAQYGGLRSAGNSLLGAFLAKRSQDKELELAKGAQDRYVTSMAQLLKGNGVPTQSPQVSTAAGTAPQVPREMDPEGNPMAQGQGPGYQPPQPQQQAQGQPNSNDFISRLIASGNPQLIQQFAPEVIKNRLEMENKHLTPLSPQEAQARGLRGVWGVDAAGNPVKIQDSDVKSQEAIAQEQATELFKNKLPMTAAQRATLGNSQAELAEKKREFNMQNPFAGGQGAPTMDSLPPAAKNMIQAMLEGRQAPPTSMALAKPYWQSLIAAANAVDPTFDQTQWGARVAARKDMLGGGKGYQTLNAGNTAIQHLGRLHDQIGDVAGSQIPLVGNLINSGTNAAARASGLPGVPAYNDTLGHLAEETTKFYRGAGGAEADVARNMGNLSADLSKAQKEAGTANTVHLIYGKLAPMVEQYNKAMNTNYPTSHFLSKDAVATIKKMGFDPDTGEKAAQSQSGPQDAHPTNIPQGSMWSPSRQQYKTPDGRILDKNGKPV